jgi:aryl-alcohol dehydrogenase-like predicted oxidoreductase
METTILGSTGRKVSRLGFGGAPAGLKDYVYRFDPGDRGQADGVVQAIRRAYELGVTYFDTAATYGDGTSERLFNEGLSGIDPARIFLATKCQPCSASEVRRSLERSLRNLGRDRVDLLQVHGSIADDQIETVLAPGGMLDEMEKLRDEGLVSHLGFTSEAQNRALYRFFETGRFEVLQVAYNFIFQHPYDPWFRDGALYEAEERNIGIVTMRSLTSGLFQRWMETVRPDDDFDYRPSLLQFCLSNPLVDVVLTGMRTVNEVEQNVAVANDLAGRIDLKAIHDHYPAK